MFHQITVEQDCAEEQHHVSPLALVGGGGLAHCPAAVAGGDEVVDSLINDALAWRAKRVIRTLSP